MPNDGMPDPVEDLIEEDFSVEAYEPPITDIEEVRRGNGGDRVPPHSIELEQQVLGAMLLSRGAIAKMSAMLDVQAFYRGRHRHIFTAITELHDEGTPADIPLIADRLDRIGVLDECGGLPYLADIAEATGTSVNVEHHARMVIEKAIRRKTISLASQLVTDSYESGDDIFTSLEEFESELFQMAERPDGGHYKPLGADMDAALERIEKRIAGVQPEIVTGWDSIDRHLWIQPGNLITIAANTGAGKTVWLENLAMNIAATGRPVGFFSLEMSRIEHQVRMVKCIARVPVRFGVEIAFGERQRLRDAAEELKTLPIFIDDCTTLTPAMLVAKARRMVHEKKIGVIIIDYVQIMTYAGKAENEAIRLGMFTQAIKRLAGELSIPIFIASQLNRENEKTNRKPTLHDLRGSGSLEEDSDVVAFIHGPPRGSEDPIRLFMLEKQRDGESRHIKLRFIGKYHRFDEMTDVEVEDVDIPAPEEDYPPDDMTDLPFDVPTPPNERAEQNDMFQ